MREVGWHTSGVRHVFFVVGPVVSRCSTTGYKLESLWLEDVVIAVPAAST
jgi:hypothetical protein